MFNPEVGIVPDCILKDTSGTLSIAPQYVKQLHFDSHGLVPVWSQSQPHGWLYADRRGRIIVTGVPEFDNSADSFHDGLVRVMHDEKYGFANRAGILVIPAVYDGALNFEKGTALVCNQCKTRCEDEHCWFTGGQWQRIDKHGRIVAHAGTQ